MPHGCAYDPTLGPQLRSVPSLSVTYYGFDVRQKPFDDVRVRQAFAHAVDWTRIVDLANTGSLTPATSMVPPGIPGVRIPTSCPPTIRWPPGRCWPPPATRVARACPRSP